MVAYRGWCGGYQPASAVQRCKYCVLGALRAAHFVGWRFRVAYGDQKLLHEPLEQVVTLANVKDILRDIFARARAAVDDGLLGRITWKPLKSTRSLQANACMWASLTDISRQVVWHGHKLEPSEWKDLLSAGLKAQKVVPNIDGNGFVVLGARTSRMSIKEMSDMIELCFAFGAQNGVKFSAPKWRDE